MNKIISCLFFVLLFLFVSCGSEKSGFSIEGTLDNLEGKPLFTIYESHGKLHTDTLFPQNGFISLKGQVTELTPVQFYRADKSKYLRLYVRDGDRIELKGDSKEPYELNVKGSDLDKELLQFCRDNKSLFQALDEEHRDILKTGNISERLEVLNLEMGELIAKYITAHKNSVLSPVLLYDYMPVDSDSRQCDSLFGLISSSVIPPYITRKWEYMREKNRKLSIDSIFGHFTFIGKNDSLKIYKPPYDRMMLFYFWKTENKQTQQNFNVLRELYRKYGKKGMDIVTVSLEADSSFWHKALRSDSIPGIPVWADGGFANKAVMNSGITRVPFCIVTNEAGMIIARDFKGNVPKDFIEKKMNGAEDKKITDN